MGETLASGTAHAAHVAHHFASADQQRDASKLGMWIFLATEILLFGGLFCAYAVYRVNHPEVFVYAHRFLDTTLGAINTVILICSSLTVAWAVRAAQLGNNRAAVVLLSATILLAAGFLGVKAVEYEHKWKDGLLWGKHYRAQAEQPGAKPTSEMQATPTPKVQAAGGSTGDERSTIPLAPSGPPGLALTGRGSSLGRGSQDVPRNVQTFFAVYFAMTGLHGLHVIAGMIVLSWILVRTARGEFGPGYATPVDLAGLYWHVVDVIWIYLFPLLYLIR